MKNKQLNQMEQKVDRILHILENEESSTSFSSDFGVSTYKEEIKKSGYITVPAEKIAYKKLVFC